MLIGKHWLSQEGDLLFVKWVGSPRADEIRELQRIVEAMAKEHGAIYMLLDMRQAQIPDAEARRVSADWPGHHLVLGIAHFGESLPIRIIETLILRGLRLLGKQLAETAFLKDESDARAWFATLRAKRRLK